MRRRILVFIMMLATISSAALADPLGAAFFDGFESGTLAAWDGLVHVPAAHKNDKVKCASGFGANTSRCALLFKGAIGEGTKLKKTLHLPPLEANVMLKTQISALLFSTTEQQLVVIVKLKLPDGTTEKINFGFLSQPMSQYQPVTASYIDTYTTAPKKAIFVLKHVTPTGKLRLDDVQLSVFDLRGT